MGAGLFPPTLSEWPAGQDGYVEGAASQTASALSSMNVVMNLIPAVLSMAGVILFACYKLNDKTHAQIIEDLKAHGEFFVDE